ncbi:mechanosensitive ion channel protein MscS [Candidatus Woesearchaeota archaeon CG_4_10_14_0_8_um_filter_47_5]|nr:MAG: mechanosensitive ion channel protein MscS [Candidatus Woesearchaeota archaeon CG_4_10_14_0_8_um_filter_47_5]
MIITLSQIKESFAKVLIESLDEVILIFLIFAGTYIMARLVRTVLTKYFEKASKIMKADLTGQNFFKHLVVAMVYIIGITLAIYTIPPLRTLSVSIFAGAGVLAIVLGFASQQALANIISGIFIVIFRPFKVGDRITMRTDIRGIVEDITLRHTVIKTFENKRVIIPNSVISNEVIENANFGDEKVCRFIDFGISYDSNINKAMKIMQEEAMKHPYFLDNRTREEKKNNEPAVTVRVIGFTDSSVSLRAWAWAKNHSLGFVLGCDLNKSIKERFDREGIEIPFPYRTIVYKDSKGSHKNSSPRLGKKFPQDS